ncbi:helix-turn-helix domain-containing protein [Acetomicrobium sp.]|uniref:helix-turn-helix domain-containing protein n=1 Tax=Acetomicrobium sp. TaxID=1872099 RepID=UPI001BCC9651|nr:helix-turn-helix domain-containing protein [Acetomicrobium sp.]
MILGVSERTIQRWKPESLKQKRLSQEEVKKIYELKEEGKSSREIANEIGVSHTAINKLETSDTCPKLPDSPTPEYFEPDDDKALPIWRESTDGT